MSETLVAALGLMWQGMLGIFIVMSAISLIVFGVTKFYKKK